MFPEHFSYYIGVDLGQRQDYTAVAIIEEPVFVNGQDLEPGEGWAWRFGVQNVEETGWISPATLHSAALREGRAANYHGGRPASVPLSLRHLERLPLDTPYPQVVERVGAMLATPPLAGRPHALVVDGTGVGVGVVDQFAAVGLKPIAVSIHGGDKVSHEQVRHGVEILSRLRVPKRELVTAAQILLQNGRLKIARQLPEAETLRRELQNFKVTIDPKTAHDSYSHWREAEHDDLVLATALAAWFRQYRNTHVDATLAEIERKPA